MVTVFGIEFGAMASSCEIRLAASDEDAARRLALPAIDEVLRIEAKFSRYRADSIVSRINAAAGQDWTECDDETLALFGYAHTLFEASGGLFDLTSGVLRRAWDFRRPVVPGDEILRPLVALVGWQRVGREGRAIRLPLAGMEIDFGGFGKEYAADRAAALLVELGVRHGYVNLGGDMHVLGPQPDGSPWAIGIQDPRAAGKTMATLALSAGALATSGDYERYFELDGQRYCHVLDPRNGRPVRHWRSVSVLAPLAIAAGSYATIAMLKEGDGAAFLANGDLAYLAVDNAGQVHQRSMTR